MREERIELSQRERDRLKVLHQVEQGYLTQAEAGQRVQVSARHLRRLHVEAGYFQDTGQQDFRFTRYNLEAVQYLPLDDGHVVVIRLLGLVNDEKGNTQIPLSEKTILGGRKSLTEMWVDLPAGAA